MRYSGSLASFALATTVVVLNCLSTPTWAAPTAAAGQWIVQPQQPQQKQQAAAGTTAPSSCFAMVGTRAYSVAGKAVHIYDPRSHHTWSVGAEPPIAMQGIQCVAAQGKVWVVSARTVAEGDEVKEETFVDALFVYDPETNAWSSKTALPLERRRGGAAVMVSDDQRYLYVSHGSIGDDATTSFLDRYEISTDTWTALADARMPRDRTGGAMSGNLLCVTGGRSHDNDNNNKGNAATTECFNTATETWTTLVDAANLPHARANAAYGKTCDGKLIVVGGEIQEGESSTDALAAFSDRVDVLDMATLQWESFPSLVSTGRHGSGLAVDCSCGTQQMQIHIINEDNGTIETYFEGESVDAPCHAASTIQRRALQEEEPSTSPTVSAEPTGATATDVPSASPTTSFKPSENQELAPGATPAPESMNAIRLNCGGPDFQDPDGHLWVNDLAYVVDGKGRTSTKGAWFAIANADDLSTIYRTERYFNIWVHPAPFVYEIPVDGEGEYALTLHFAEIFFENEGARKFDVWVEGELIMDDLDIVAAAGGTATAFKVTFLPYVSDNSLTIQFINLVQHPKISAIEVTDASTYVAPTGSPTSSPAPTAAPTVATPAPTSGTMPTIRLNCGGGQFTDAAGNLWLNDTPFVIDEKGSSNVKDQLTITNASGGLTPMYQSERAFTAWTGDEPYIYEIPVRPVEDYYAVTLHFAETHFQLAAKRVFDVYVEGDLFLENFDPYAVAGGYATGYQVTIVPFVTDGFVTIEFKRVKNHPKISGIEIADASTYVPPTDAPTSSPAPTAAPTVATPAPTSGSMPTIHLNCGGGQFTDAAGNLWLNDTPFVIDGTGTSTVKDQLTITNASGGLTPMYQSERAFTPWGGAEPYIYEIPVRPAEDYYAVTLHFAETHFQFAAMRVFDVYVEGDLLLENFDPYVMAGGYATGYHITVVPFVTDGFVTIEFQRVINHPKISGIEIADASTYVPPTDAPTSSPAPTAAPTSISEKKFEDIYINSGGGQYLGHSGDVTWLADRFFTGGGVFYDGKAGLDIESTLDDTIYKTERHGSFTYEIPVPVGSYEVILHFAELYWTEVGKRKFDVSIEDKTFTNVDIVDLGGGVGRKAMTLEAAVIVSDGFVSIEMKDASPKVDQGKLSAIVVKLVGPHLAHSVAGGPYRIVDLDGDGYGEVAVDGGGSHTHATGHYLNQFIWKEGPNTLANTEAATFSLPVGEHPVKLTVIDDAGNVGDDETTVEVLPSWYPVVLSVTPDTGSIAGNELVTIFGSGFNCTAEEIVVHFGLVDLSGSDLIIKDQNTIELTTPATVVGAPVMVSVETPIALSNADLTYTYVAGAPIEFESGTVTTVTPLEGPTTVKFGPDRRLYVGHMGGKLTRITFKEGGFTEVAEKVTATVANWRPILGITFDPRDTKEFPDVYVSSNYFFHGEIPNSFGESVNGRVYKMSGSNLEEWEIVVSGLPVSDHDHGIVGLEAGNEGQLWIQSGSNTNGGLAGQLSGSQQQTENYLSASTLVARNFFEPNFDGHIEYSAPVDGVPVKGDIEVYASGMRNPFGIVLHSNGYLYGTDNGSNPGYGDMATGCGPEDYIPDKYTSDKINRITEGSYYGHPNPIRALATGDLKQCVWHDPALGSTEDFTAPILIVPSSMNGIIEWTSDHFGGQLRGDLITSKYGGSLYRAILTPDGKNVIPQSNPALKLPIGSEGLDVTQAPDGTLIECRLPENNLNYHKPVEQPTTEMGVKSVFPSRGPLAGGNVLDVYGVNFGTTGAIVQIGNLSCPVISQSSTKIECTLPAGAAVGLYDVTVTVALESYTFKAGYRYIHW